MKEDFCLVTIVITEQMKNEVMALCENADGTAFKDNFYIHGTAFKDDYTPIFIIQES